jgi:hypothetical protein
VRVLELLKHFQLIVDHLLISPNILLQDDLDCDFLPVMRLSLTNNAVGASTKGPSELVQRPKINRAVSEYGRT